MTIPMTAAWIIVAILCTWFLASCYYDMRSHKQKKRIAKLERDLTHAEFEIERRDACIRDFIEECG